MTMGFDELVAGVVHDPHAILGAHPDGSKTVVRTMRRGAKDVAVVVGGQRTELERVHGEGVFEATLPGTVTDYRLDVDGVECDEPYRFGPTVGELDLHLIAEGRHERLWTARGAQCREYGSAHGVSCAV